MWKKYLEILTDKINNYLSRCYLFMYLVSCVFFTFREWQI